MKNDLKIVFIAPGPAYNPGSSSYQNRFTLLSKQMSGYILTTSNNNIIMNIGRFEFAAVKRGNSKIVCNLKLLWHCVRFALSKGRGGGIDCIVAYDPLKTGLIGCMLKYLMKAKLVIEVNGVYTSPAAWMDEHVGFGNSLKKRVIPCVMSLVFRCADGIKLQFPAQIDQFDKEVTGKIVKDFPNLTPVDRFENFEESKEVLLVGFPFKLKGVDILIEAFKKVSPEFPEWHLKILGWYPNPTNLELAIGGHPKIMHHQPVEYKEMPQHIGRCGIVAQPSRTDALPRVLIEAAAAGKPRIGSRVDGIPIAIEDGIDGLLVEPDNVDDLAEKLSMLMKDKDLRFRLGEAAAKKAITTFSASHYLENTYSLYSQVASR